MCLPVVATRRFAQESQRQSEWQINPTCSGASILSAFAHLQTGKDGPRAEFADSVRQRRVCRYANEFTRESLAIEVGTSFVSERVCQTLERLIKQRGVPAAFRMDNGPEFVALALRGLCHRHGVDPAYIDPGKPWQNGFAESFHSRLRDEFMNGEVFYGVKEAQVRLSSCRYATALASLLQRRTIAQQFGLSDAAGIRNGFCGRD